VDARHEDAFAWGEQAIDLARRCRDPRSLAQALNTVGAARHRLDPSDDSLLTESLELARAEGLHDGTLARAYVNLAVCHLEGMQYGEAARYLAEGLDYCDRHDVYIFTRYLLSIRSWWHMEQGRWEPAETDLAEVIDEDSVVAIRALRVKGMILARRGDPEAKATLRRAFDLADRLGESQGLIPISAALAERAWLAGEMEEEVDTLQSMYRRALRSRVPRWMGETATWLARAGLDPDPPPETALPHRLQIQGEWREAANLWAELGRPYEEADALGELEDPEALHRSLAILDRLGALPRAAQVRRKMSSLGIEHIPRGPTPATRDHPAGLTPRQAEVLGMLAEGLTYRQIADRLFVSPKTVDHHATAIRAKLAVATRHEAVAEARRLGLLDG
ncbi:MAG: LuxR C-terminal-related transcriptional regulator, partial [Actinomycetota bacterium]